MHLLGISFCHTISNVCQNIQVEISSGPGGHTEVASAENSNTKSEERSTEESNDKEMTLGDALSQIKDESSTSLEELQNLAGGADIKVKRSAFVITLDIIRTL